MASSDCTHILDKGIGKIVADLMKATKTKRGYIEDLDKKTMDDIRGIVADIKTTSINEVESLTKPVLEALRKDIAVKFYHAINSNKAAKENIGMLETMLTGAKRDIKHAVNSFYERTAKYLNLEEQHAERMLQRVFEDTYKRGKVNRMSIDEAKRLLLDHQEGGDELIKKLQSILPDDTDLVRDLHRAFAKGHWEGFVPKTPEGKEVITTVNIIANTFKKWSELVDARIEKNGAVFGSVRTSVLPMKENWLKMSKMKRSNYINHAKTYIDFDETFKTVKRKQKYIKRGKKISDEEIEGFLNSRFETKSNNPTAPGVTYTLSTLDKGVELKFKNPDDAHSYIAPLLREDTDFIRTAFGSRVDMLKESRLIQLHGNKIARTNELVKRKILTNPDNKLSDAQVDNIITKATQGGPLGRFDPNTGFGELTAVVSKVISNLLSAGLTQYTAMRTFVLDSGWHSAWMKTQLSEKGMLHNWMKNQAELMGHMVKIKKTRELGQFYEDQGARIYISANQIAQNVSKVATSFSDEASKAVKTSRKIADWSSKWGGANWVLNASRVQNSADVQSLIFRELMTEGWDSVHRVMKDVLFQAGVTRADWDVLRNLPKQKIAGQERWLDFSGVTDQKLMDKYAILHTTMLDDAVAMVNIHGTPPLASSSPFLSLVTKFWGINLSQYRSALRYTRAAQGLTPGGGDLGSLGDLAMTSHQSRWALLRYIGSGAAAGMMYQWTQDLTQLREPRDLSPENVLMGLTQTGIGGVPMIMANGYYYNKDILGTPLSAAGGRAYRLGASLGSDAEGTTARASKEALRLVPGADWWYTRAARDFLFYKTLGVPQSPHKKKKAKDDGNPYIYLDNY